jgi:hypothetical protein
LYKLKVLRKQDRKVNLSGALEKFRLRLDQEIVVDWEWLEEKYTELIKTESK